ncbi:MAG: S8 family serine peptidase [Candidatus Edwardsbacteria bacterium]|nr:S8 family serine peptidase [Candidatus Edwardsbacteria bacterium]
MMLTLAAGALAAAADLTPALRARLSAASPADRVLCWVGFSDKGAARGLPALPARAVERRRRAGRALGYGDLPVDPAYAAAVAAAGATVRYASAWLNAVSVSATPAALAAIARLPFVAEIDALPVYRTAVDRAAWLRSPGKQAPALDYGSAAEQIRLMRIDELHRMGYTGSGVRLAFLDSGFDREHEALQRARIVAERDFQRMVRPLDQYGDPDTTRWRPDSVTAYEQGQDTSRVQTWHGTGMLSIAGAYKAGSLIGSAYNADFILGKTEHVHSLTEADFQREEDWFVAGLEWAADTAGADIISSSLGYRQWRDSADYAYADMNGAAARCTRAADSAAARGVLVLNSMGNIGDAAVRNGRPDTCILAPADGQGVLAVGGVWPGSRAWAYPPVGTTGSGPAAGPAADSVRYGPDSVMIRRIKPDVSSSWQNYYAYNEPDPLTAPAPRAPRP